MPSHRVDTPRRFTPLHWFGVFIGLLGVLTGLLVFMFFRTGDTESMSQGTPVKRTAAQPSVSANSPSSTPLLPALPTLEPVKRTMADVRKGDLVVFRQRVYYFQGWTDATRTVAVISWFAQGGNPRTEKSTDIVPYGVQPSPYVGP